MGIINTILGIPLGFAIYLFYGITGSYGLAVVIFAVFVKVVLIPVNRMAHRNSIKLLRLQPALGTIRRRYAGDKERLNEEQYELFTKEKYSPLLGLLPLFVQLFLVIGMLQVMYHPLQHILRLDSGVIDALTAAIAPLYEGNVIEQLAVLAVAGQGENLILFQEALAPFYNGGAVLTQLINTDLNFLGINLGVVPSLTNPSIELVVPAFALAAALAFCLVQNRLSPGALSQSKRTGLFFTIFTMGLSLYFSLVTPAGVGLYWSLGNLAAIGVVLILNALYNPKKLAAEALAYINANRKTPQQLKEEKHTKKALAARERQDAARFAAADKKLVFYALTGGQYRYYKNIIDYLLEHSEITIHYLTNDPNDSVFKHENKKIVPYYAGHRKTVFLMLNLNTAIFVTTVPDLQTFHMKRSVVRENIEYIFVPHTVGSVHVTLKEAACDHFDTVFCVGPHQAAEVRRREEYANLSKKKLIKAGYGLYDTLAQSYKELTANKNEEPDSPKKILIAPSWQPDNILDLCIEDILTSLQGQGFEITVRPHPQYVSLFPERMKVLQERYSQHDDITFGLDISDNVSVFSADILITDWSNISYEFAYCTLKPCIFINTPMKIMNPNYERLGLENVDVSIRDKIGISVDVDNVRRLHKIADDLLAGQAGYRERITQVMEQYLYYPMRNGEAGGRYIIQNIQKV